MKSPLTPITNELAAFRSFKVQEEPDNAVTDDGYSASQKDNTRRWIQNIHNVGTTGMHSKTNSVSTIDIITSPTETGTVRGSTVAMELQIPVDEEEPDQSMTALGLSNMIPAQPSPSTIVHVSQEQPVAVAEPPRPAGSPVPPSEAPSRPLSIAHSIPRNDSGQDIEVRLDDGHLFHTVRLTTPHNSSLIINRSRRNTEVTGNAPQLLKPNSDVDITTTHLQPSPNPQTIDLPVEDDTPDGLTPPIEYDEDEPPSRARQRFQKAYLLVTKELRQRVAHLRKSPTSPNIPKASDSEVGNELLSELGPNEPSSSSLLQNAAQDSISSPVWTKRTNIHSPVRDTRRDSSPSPVRNRGEDNLSSPIRNIGTGTPYSSDGNVGTDFPLIPSRDAKADSLSSLPRNIRMDAPLVRTRDTEKGSASSLLQNAKMDGPPSPVPSLGMDVPAVPAQNAQVGSRSFLPRNPKTNKPPSPVLNIRTDGLSSSVRDIGTDSPFVPNRSTLTNNLPSRVRKIGTDIPSVRTRDTKMDSHSSILQNSTENSPSSPTRNMITESRSAPLQSDQTDSPSVLDDYMADETVEVDSNHETEDRPTDDRPWLKPFRLSTIGSAGIASAFTAHSRPASRSERSLTRPSSPEKRLPALDMSRRSSRMERKGSSASHSAISQTDFPLANWAHFSPAPTAFTPPQTTSSSRKGSVHYIHSPRPAKWTSIESQGQTYPPSARSVSPVRASRTNTASSASELRRPLSTRSQSAFATSAPPVPPLPTQKPELFFAIASSQPEQVAHLLATGQASPNATVGPHDMHALAFALDNMAHSSAEKRPQQEEIVSTLLSYGADPRAAEATAADTSSENGGEAVNPLIRYFLDKAQRSPVAAARQSDADDVEIALKRAKFTVVGQEFGVDELSRAYAAHARLARFLDEDEDDREMPFVALLSGPSGHGKTLLATRVGKLLGLPSYSINMTVVKGQKDVWSTPSYNGREASEYPTLRHFLQAHDGKKKIVVIDEIEKVDDMSLLQSFLVPWETGRVQDGTSGRTIDISRSIWIGTSNVGSSEIIGAMKDVSVLDAGRYKQLVKDTRACLRETLGASLVARVSCIVAFVPFSHEEQLAISSKSLSALQRKIALSQPSLASKTMNNDKMWKGVVEQAASHYIEEEGARSIRQSLIRLADTILQSL